MDFAFINELTKALSSTNIFKFTFTGFKVLAFALLSLRVLEAFAKDFDNKEPKIGNLMSILGYGLVIMSSDWIMTTIEDIFSQIDVVMQNTSSDLFFSLNLKVAIEMNKVFKEANDWWDYMGAIASNLMMIVSLIVTWILGALCKIADLSITAGYLVQRIVIMKLLVLLFPLAVALSTYSGTAKLFHTWILRYIGIFILGIAYIGIINVTELIQNLLVAQFDNKDGFSGSLVNGGLFSIGILVAMIGTFTIKVKLFSTVTSYVMGMFQ